MVVIESNGGFFLFVGKLAGCLQQGADAGAGGADGGQQTDDAADDHDPYAEIIFALQPVCQQQGSTGWK